MHHTQREAELIYEVTIINHEKALAVLEEVNSGGPDEQAFLQSVTDEVARTLAECGKARAAAIETYIADLERRSRT